MIIPLFLRTVFRSVLNVRQLRPLLLLYRTFDPLISPNLANNAGYFKAEIEPIKVKGRKGEESFEVDEHPREVTIENLAKLPPVFKKEGLVTAGNASVRPLPSANGNCTEIFRESATARRQ